VGALSRLWKEPYNHMKTNLFATLFVGAALAVPAFSQNGADVFHYTTRGYSQAAYMSANGINGMFMVEQNMTIAGGRQMGTNILGYASGILPNGHLVLYTTDWNGWSGTLVPSNPQMTIPGTGAGWFTGTRTEFTVGPFGISLVSRDEGVFYAGATIQNPAFLDTTKDKDHFTLTIPGIGRIFTYNSSYRGRIGFEPEGTGYMSFTANGVTETIFAPGTPISPASWMGWFHTKEVEISGN